MDNDEEKFNMYLTDGMNHQKKISDRVDAFCSLFDLVYNNASVIGYVIENYKNLFFDLKMLLGRETSEELLRPISMNLGYISSLLSGNMLIGFIDWMLSNLSKGRYYVITLKYFLQFGGNRIRSYVPELIVELFKFLDGISDYELMFPCIEIIKEIRLSFPDLFDMNFQKFIDHLVGWRLDVFVSRSCITNIQHCFEYQFKAQWNKYFTFTQNLLKDLVVDLNSNVNTLSTTSSNLPKRVWEELIVISQCFTEILEGVGPVFISVPKGITIIEDLITFLKDVNDRYQYPKWQKHCSTLLLKISNNFKADFLAFYPLSLSLNKAVLKTSSSLHVLQSVLNTNLLMMKCQISFQELINPQLYLCKEFLDLRCKSNNHVISLLFDMFNYLLDIPHLRKTIVDFFISDLSVNINNKDLISLTNSLFDIQLLSNIESFVIHLLKNYNPMLNERIKKSRPLQYAITRVILNADPSNFYRDDDFRTFLIHTFDTKVKSLNILALDWIILNPSRTIMTHELFSCFFELSSNSDTLIRCKLGEALSSLVPNLDQSHLQVLLILALRMLTDTDKNVRSSFFQILLNFPLDFSAQDIYTDKLTVPEHIKSTFLWKDTLKQLVNSSEVNFDDFSYIKTQKVLEGEFPPLNWISRLFASLVSNGIPEANDIKKLLDINSSVSIYWVISESVRYLINNRLHTSNSDPNSTFESLKRLLKKPLSFPELRNYQMAHLVNDEDVNEENIQYIVRALLHFMDNLEKEMYNAYEGSLSLNRTENPGVLQFFYSNKKVCKDWFSQRFRIQLYECSKVCASPVDLIRNGFEQINLLMWMLNSTEEEEKIKKLRLTLKTVLYEITDSMLKLKDPDAMTGLYEWLNRNSGINVPTKWLEGVVYQCKSKYERAIHIYKECLESKGKTSNYTDYLCTKILECSDKLSDWDTMNWSIHSLKKNSEGTNVQNLDYYEALSSFYQGNKGITSNILDANIPSLNKYLIDLCNPEEKLFSVQELILKFLCHNEKPNTEKLAPILENLILKPLSVLGAMDDSYDNINQYLNNLKCFKIISERNLKDINLPKSVDPLHHDVGDWSNILRTAEAFCDNSQLDAIKLPLINLARKHSNFRYCEKLLEQVSSDKWEFCLERAKLFHSKGEEEKAINIIKNLLESHSLNIEINEKLLEWSGDEEKDQLFNNLLVLDPQNDNIWSAYGNWLYSKASQSSSFHRNKMVMDIEDQLEYDELTKAMSIEKNAELHELFSSLPDSNDLGRDRENWIIERLGYIIEYVDLVGKLSSLWLRMRKKNLRTYFGAMQAYCKFLNLYHTNQAEQMTKATLRILRLILRYSGDFSEDILNDLASIPADAWLDIIPQIFSHLDHPSTAVREIIEGILLKIAGQYPHLVIYPTVVGDATSEPAPYKGLMAYLMENYSQLVTEVKLLIEEFGRITLLWEEQWGITIRGVQNDLQSRKKTLEDEVRRVELNEIVSSEEKNRIIQEKYKAIMQPIFFKINKYIEMISGDPGSEHEKQFQHMFLKKITHALNEFENPTEPLNVSLNFQQFQEISQQIVEFQKQSSVENKHLKDLNNLSPKLMTSQFSSVPVPGIGLNSVPGDTFVTIHSLKRNIVIVQSKTKPKKIQLVGSDGLVYTFLLKGRDDLHLDERMMQFLNIVNRMLKSDGNCRVRNMRARNYAVIPFSHTSGIIQWVDHTTPLFSFYKNRIHNNCLANDKKPQTPVQQFYQKVKPLMKEMKIPLKTPRHKYPLKLLQFAYQELSRETPDDIISNEIWCSSNTVSEWWRKQTIFARSTAVMSMIGYVIGLGDRHLENILLDQNSGEIVHIDYNICFDKGKELRIPEVVPFRLTQNIVKAFGFTGVSGHFTEGAINVMKILRKNRESLITLLEAFVYDPLVDWKSESKEKDEERQMKVNMLLSLLSSRIEEISAAFPRLKNILNKDLHAISINLDNIRDFFSHTKELSRKIRETKEKVKLQKSTEQPLINIEEKIKEKEKLQDKLETVHEEVVECKNQCSTSYEKCMQGFEFLKDDRFLSMNVNVSDTYQNTITRFQIGNQKFVDACQATEAELQQLCQSRDHLLNEIWNILRDYREVILGTSDYEEKNLACVWNIFFSKVLDSEKPIHKNHLNKLLELHHIDLQYDISQLIDLRQDLIQNMKDIDRCAQKYNELEGTIANFIKQRSPNNLASLQQASNGRNKSLSLHKNKSRMLCEISGSVLQFELSSTSRIQSDEKLMSLHQGYLNTYKNYTQIISSIKKIDDIIASNANSRPVVLIEDTQDYDQLLKALHRESKEYQSNIRGLKNKLLSTSDSLVKNLDLSDFNTIFTEIESFLDTIQKISDDWGTGYDLFVAVSQIKEDFNIFFKGMNHYIITINEIMEKNVLRELPHPPEDFTSFQDLAPLVTNIYENLPTQLQDLVSYKYDPNEIQNVDNSETVVNRSEDSEEQENSGKIMKNAYAMSILSNVNERLEGKVNSVKYPIQEQVKLIISEAASPDNLCQLYEGWSSWI
eukprot:TRINITY_DN6046_c0_g1_i1.p1 TRINITY_DN6046_c0_g1~~TRINITY_DN6046_c0_g1_i1.p1  ORF type:complete len:2494 (-),score=424.74 TRINITY_DN6046_c0_g1_i1:14-7495(-)